MFSTAQEYSNLDYYVLAKAIISQEHGLFNDILSKLIKSNKINLELINIPNNYVYNAIKKGQLDIVKHLVSKGAKLPRYAVRSAVIIGNLDMTRYFLEEKGLALDSFSVESAVSGANLTILRYLLEERGAEICNHPVELAVMANNLETVKYLVEEGYAIDEDVIDRAVKEASIDIVKYLIKKVEERLAIRAFYQSVKNNNQILISFLKDVIKLSLAQVLSEALTMLDTEVVMKLFNEYSVELNDVYIGISNIYGQWSSEVLLCINDISEKKGVYYLPINSNNLDNELFISKFSGFINPGGEDSFPRDREFSLADLDKSKMLESEIIYQKVINLAKKYRIPYLGICSGAQHLLLNNGGVLKFTPGYFNADHKVIFYPTTITHFMSLSYQEQIRALLNCEFPDIEYSVTTNHNFAGINSKLGVEVKLGACSEEGVPEAFSQGVRYIAVQFHPEKDYFNNDINNRQKIFLENFIKMAKRHHQEIKQAESRGFGFNEIYYSLDGTDQTLLNKLSFCLDKIVSPVKENNPFIFSYDQEICRPDDYQDFDFMIGEII
jgi:gamma-glutamyl-gamma-aminobutyrate hydrolase PuuD